MMEKVYNGLQFIETNCICSNNVFTITMNAKKINKKLGKINKN